MKWCPIILMTHFYIWNDMKWVIPWIWSSGLQVILDCASFPLRIDNRLRMRDFLSPFGFVVFSRVELQRLAKGHRFDASNTVTMQRCGGGVRLQLQKRIRATVGQNYDTNFRKLKPLDFYQWGDFGQNGPNFAKSNFRKSVS